MNDPPSLAAFERLLVHQHRAEALEIALGILNSIEAHRGLVDQVITDALRTQRNKDDIAVIFATRFAAAFGRLITDPGFEITATDYERLMSQHRWIDLVFSISGFRSADHLLSLISKNKNEDQLTFDPRNFRRLLPLLTMNSSIEIDLDTFWRADAPASAIAFLNYISARCVFSRSAFELRERILEWLPAKLMDVKLSHRFLARLPEVYMHCSYATTAKKHALKLPLMRQMRRACLEAGIIECGGAAPVSNPPPTVIVVGELFLPGHSMFRCFAPAVQALRSRFNLVGVIYPNPADPVITRLFDETIPFPAGDFLETVRILATEMTARKPALIWYLGVGMVARVVALASLRLAPLQCASFGHNASTMSPVIDYFILPEDILGSPDCFSEKVMALPKAAMPFVPRRPAKVQRKLPDGKVRVAISASTMKLNPMFFEAVARIASIARQHVEFHFFPLAAIGLSYFELSRVVRARIPRAKVFSETTFERYMELLAHCDLFLSSFPHGGMNSVIDAFQLGMPGVCLDGSEPHAHADAAIFARVGLPREVIAKSIDEYVAGAVRLIDDETWRAKCAEVVRNADLDEAFFRGDANLFGEAIEKLIRNGVQ